MNTTALIPRRTGRPRRPAAPPLPGLAPAALVVPALVLSRPRQVRWRDGDRLGRAVGEVDDDLLDGALVVAVLEPREVVVDVGEGNVRLFPVAQQSGHSTRWFSSALGPASAY